jgi:hypothetical protein
MGNSTVPCSISWYLRWVGGIGGLVTVAKDWKGVRGRAGRIAKGVSKFTVELCCKSRVSTFCSSPHLSLPTFQRDRMGFLGSVGA